MSGTPSNERIAKLEVKVENLTKQVEKLTATVERLAAAFDRIDGGKRALILAGTALAAISSAITATIMKVWPWFSTMPR